MSYVMRKGFKPLEVTTLYSIQAAALFFILGKHFSKLRIFAVLTFEKQQSLETMWTCAQDEHWNLGIVISAIQRIVSVGQIYCFHVAQSVFITR